MKNFRSLGCLSCNIVSSMIEPEGGTILETEHFHGHQDFAYPIPGFVILAAKRHFYYMHELTPSELSEFTQLLFRIRKAQLEALGIETVYYFYNEDTTHHFHLWMLPRYEWMQQIGRSVESVRPVLHYAAAHHNTAENQKEVRKSAQKLRETLNM